MSEPNNKTTPDEPAITPEMLDWFEKRTRRHIGLVQKYAKIIAERAPEFAMLPAQAASHDDSKWQEPEKTPYVWISWDYHQKDLGNKLTLPADLKEKMSVASEHHVTSNSHHPEFWCRDEEGKSQVALINRDDRDNPPAKLIDATKMTDICLAELCADWMAMSEEKGGDPIQWADKNINVRWKFTPEQETLIRRLIGLAWKNPEGEGEKMDDKTKESKPPEADKTQDEAGSKEARIKSAYMLLALENLAAQGLTVSELGRMALQAEDKLRKAAAVRAGIAKLAQTKAAVGEEAAGGILGPAVSLLGRGLGAATGLLGKGLDIAKELGKTTLTIVLPVAGGGAGLAAGYLAEELSGPDETDVAREAMKQQVNAIRRQALRQAVMAQARMQEKEDGERERQAKARRRGLQISSAV